MAGRLVSRSASARFRKSAHSLRCRDCLADRYPTVGSPEEENDPMGLILYEVYNTVNFFTPISTISTSVTHV